MIARPGQSPPPSDRPALLAISDLHVEPPENRRFADELQPRHPDDWLIVAGDVADRVADIGAVLAKLATRFQQVIWVPGNHDLWTPPDDPVQLRGVARYEHLVAICRRLGVLTPEDPFPVWDRRWTIAPLFTLYDYSFGRNIAPTKAQALARAHDAGVVCSDEFLLHPDPYASREAWCAARVAYTRDRLRELARPPVLISHFPLRSELTRPLFFPEFAQWCGTLETDDWHARYGAAAVVYGHLHIARTTEHDGVPFHEVSVGYPREWRRRGRRPSLRLIASSETP